jgi:hypothetical protein
MARGQFKHLWRRLLKGRHWRPLLTAVTNCRCWYLGPSENSHFVMAISMMLVCLNSK